MIRRVTSHQLVGVVIRHKRTSHVELKAASIFRVERHLITEDVDTYLGWSSFMELKSDYPEFITLTRDAVLIENSSELRKKLDQALRFARDEEIETTIWRSWQSRK